MVAQAQRHDDVASRAVAGRELSLDTRVGADLGVEGLENLIAGDRRFAAQPREQVRASLPEVGRAGSHAVGM